MSNNENPWDQRFNTPVFVYGQEPNEFLRLKADSLLPGRTLSIAEGEGRNAVFLAKKGLDVTAWDYSRVALEKCGRFARQQGVSITTELVDLTRANWVPGKWQNVVAVFAHFPSAFRPSILHGIENTVAPGGVFVAEVYSVHQLAYGTGGPRDEDMLYRPEEFLQTFQNWHITHFFMGEVERHEGELHNGTSHVIQFLGKKTGVIR